MRDVVRWAMAEIGWNSTIYTRCVGDVPWRNCQQDTGRLIAAGIFSGLTAHRAVLQLLVGLQQGLVIVL